MITFIEHHVEGYAARTQRNIKETDVTIAFATDFTTSGERVTKSLCEKYKKLYIPCPIIKGVAITIKDIDNIRSLMNNRLALVPMRINIAGNGIYTLIKSGITQKIIDDQISMVLYYLTFEMNVDRVQSGGQTGVDEAGIKGAHEWGLNALCVAPKHWMFRDIEGKDIRNERLFKQRFYE